MNQRFRIYRRQAGVFYLFDRATGKRESLDTKAGRDKGIAALAPAHGGGTADLQYDLVLTRLEDALRHNDLEWTGGLIHAHFLTVDEGRKRSTSDRTTALSLLLWLKKTPN